MRSLLPVSLLMVLWALCAPPAHATAQAAERIRIEGYEYSLQSEPLASWLESHPTVKERLTSVPLCSALWRGYRGTWELDCGRLYLRRVEAWGELSNTSSRWEVAHLDGLDLRDGARVHARWYTGILIVPRGRSIGPSPGVMYGWYERTMLFGVVRGVVQWQRTLGLEEGALRSVRDHASLDPARVHVPDHRRWVDAREIWSEAFARRVPMGTRFTTRGIFHARTARDAPRLVVPYTRVSSWDELPLRGRIPPDTLDDRLVELDVCWLPDLGGPMLEVHAVRVLRPGQSIHKAQMRWLGRCGRRFGRLC